MKSRVSVMCSLVLSASLASCAPTLQGSNGESYKPDVQVGGYMLTVPRVALAELNDQTPDTTYVTLPNCNGAVVSVRDVRKLGVEQATQVCNQATQKTFGLVGGIIIAITFIFSGIVLYVLSLFSHAN